MCFIILYTDLNGTLSSLRKTSHLLLALSKLVDSRKEKSAYTYYALDLERRELERTLSDLMAKYGDALAGKVNAKGMWGTYEGGLSFIEEGGIERHSSEPADQHSLRHRHRTFSSSSSSSRSPSIDRESTPPTSVGHEVTDSTPLHILFLGSSLGNFDRPSSAGFLRSLPLRPGSGDTLLIGLDHDNSKEEIEQAYNDPKGVTRDFIMNGLKVAGRSLGNESLFEETNWKYVNKYNVAERMS